MKKIFLAIIFAVALTGCGEQEKIIEDKKEEIKEGIAQKQEEMKEQNQNKEKSGEWKVVETDSFKIEFPEEPVNQSTDIPVVEFNAKMKMDI